MSESSNLKPAAAVLGQLPRTYRFGQRTGLNYTTESLADADLSGIGVTVSFMITALVTFLLLLYGLRRNIILDDPGLQHPLDKALFKRLGSKTPPIGAQRLREKRALNATMISLGDQQILVGIGFLVAGIQNPTLNVYSLRNLVAISWLSATTLLCTLIVTNQDSIKTSSNMILKRIRALGMVILLILILYAYILYLWAAYQTETLYKDIWNLEERKKRTNGEYQYETGKYAVYYFFGKYIKDSFYQGALTDYQNDANPGFFQFYHMSLILFIDIVLALVIVFVFLHHFLAFYFGAMHFAGVRLLAWSWIFRGLKRGILGHFNPTGFRYAEFRRTAAERKWRKVTDYRNSEWPAFNFVGVSINGSEETIKEPGNLDLQSCYYPLLRLLKSRPTRDSTTSNHSDRSGGQFVERSQHRIESDSGPGLRSGNDADGYNCDTTACTNEIPPPGRLQADWPPIATTGFRCSSVGRFFRARRFFFQTIIYRPLRSFLNSPHSTFDGVCLVNEALSVYLFFLQSFTRFVICWTVFRTVKDEETSKGITNWGLGQVVAIALLPGPFLAWAQEYYDYIPSKIATPTTTSTGSSCHSSDNDQIDSTDSTEQPDDSLQLLGFSNSDWSRQIIENFAIPYLKGNIKDSSALAERNIAIELSEGRIAISYRPPTSQQYWKGCYRLLSADEVISEYYQSRAFSGQATFFTTVRVLILASPIFFQIDWELGSFGEFSLYLVEFSILGGGFLSYIVCYYVYSRLVRMLREIKLMKLRKKNQVYSTVLFQVASSVGYPTGRELEAGDTETMEEEKLRKIGAMLALERRTQAKLKVSAAEENERIRRQFAAQKIKELEESEATACKRVEEAFAAVTMPTVRRGEATTPTWGTLGPVGIEPPQVGRDNDSETSTTASPTALPATSLPQTSDDATNSIDDGELETCDEAEIENGQKAYVQHVPVASEEIGIRSESYEGVVIEEGFEMNVLHRN